MRHSSKRTARINDLNVHRRSLRRTLLRSRGAPPCSRGELEAVEAERLRHVDAVELLRPWPAPRCSQPAARSCSMTQSHSSPPIQLKPMPSTACTRRRQRRAPSERTLPAGTASGGRTAPSMAWRTGTRTLQEIGPVRTMRTFRSGLTSIFATLQHK